MLRTIAVVYLLCNWLKKNDGGNTHGVKLKEVSKDLGTQTGGYKVLIRKLLATAYKDLSWSTHLQRNYKRVRLRNELLVVIFIIVIKYSSITSNLL